ncbi:putative mucin-associated surface protein (MASP) [Trypanosoma conorhini]|uniref:Putative mucin-associated surface protein (MASP) n=1 Tax=Trypanosoma conorhini TaxID=83891 RepID=A0A422Q3Y0_9TRYP|nr:putative mucin-associated surface protein (MASP) [Trypanosoma conorhini]RNF24660.1 putative mucin-associated surface protein (MASP) [Trypanosoma conorhini]
MRSSYSRQLGETTGLPRALSASPGSLRRQSAAHLSISRRRRSRNVSMGVPSRRSLRPSYAEEPVPENRRPSTARVIEYHLTHRPTRQSGIDTASGVGQNLQNDRIAKSLLPQEILALDSVELGFSSPGSVTLWKLLLPLERANYPFNVHERRKPFIPGDAVSVQMGQNSMKVSFARAEDVVQPSPGRLRKASVLDIVNNGVIGEVKYPYVQRIESVVPTVDAQIFMARLSGVVGFTLQLCFAERSLCSAFVKLLVSHCHGHITVADEVGVCSSAPPFLAFETPRRSLSSAPVSRFVAGRSPSAIFVFPRDEDQKTDEEANS